MNNLMLMYLKFLCEIYKFLKKQNKSNTETDSLTNIKSVIENLLKVWVPWPQ